MEIFKGKVAFSGITIGKILYYSREDYQIRQYVVTNVKKELGDFRKAVLQVQKHLQQLYEETNGGAPEGVSVSARIYAQQLRLLEEKEYAKAIQSMIEGQKVSAGYAIKTTRDEMLETFSEIDSQVVRERLRNIRDVSGLLLKSMGQSTSRIDLGDDPVILISENLLPTEILEMDKTKLLAVCTRQGSEISHGAIMAKTIGIPALFDVPVDDEWDGRMAIVDGYTGTIYLDPAGELLKEYRMRQNDISTEREELMHYRDKEDVTADGERRPIYANIGSLDDLNSVSFYGAAGIGLLRSEFQYLGRNSYPIENDLFLEYKKLAERMGKKETVIRTVDLGGDKKAAYMDFPHEDNPIMGNRGIRLCLDQKEILKTQLRAIYRASIYGNFSVMFPMITSLEELDEIDQMIREILAELERKKIQHKHLKRGIMIETPAAVMIAEELAERVDFLSLGTNDLTQYTLAMDRQNPYLQRRYDDHHPAIFRMIRMTAEGAHKKGKKVFICGELAADTAWTERFLQMGIDGFSVVPACILPVRRELCRSVVQRPEDK